MGSQQCWKLQFLYGTLIVISEQFMNRKVKILGKGWYSANLINVALPESFQ